MRIFNIFLVLAFLSSTAYSQTDAHYWSHQFGAHGLLLNGAVISSALDETSIYYNPGSITLDGNLGFAFSFISPTYSNLSNENFLGNGTSLSDRGLGFSPGFLAVRFRPFKTDKIVAGVASFKRLKSNTNFDDRIVDNINPTDVFVFRSDLKFNRKKSEDWYGLALGYKINENLGIGISQFSVWHGQSLELDFTKEILLSRSPSSIVQSWKSKFDYNLDVHSGWISKLGLSYVADNFGIGLTVTTPMYGVVRSSASYAIDDQKLSIIDTSFQVISNRASLDDATYKSPLSIGLGIDFGFGKYRFFASSEYFRNIETYTLFSDTSDTFDGVSIGESEYTISLTSGNEHVLNVAFGIEYLKNDRMTYLWGFRTDFNQIDNLMINQSAEYLSSTPDIFHISGGVLKTFGSSVFSLGVDLSYGKATGGRQLTDLSNITIDNIFTFSGDNSVESQYYSISIFLTYDFIFERIASSRKHQH